MKNIKRILLSLIFVLGFSMSSFAQSGVSVRAGGNALWLFLFYLVSLSDDDEEVGHVSENNNYRDNKSGVLGIPIGLNAGLKYQFNLLGNLDMFASADVFFRGCDDPTVSFEDMHKDKALPSRVNFPLLLGFNYTVIERDDVALWTELGAGINYSRFRTQRVMGGTWPDNIEVSTFRHWGITPAWNVGVGVTVDERYSLVVSCFSYDNPELQSRNYAGKVGAIGDWANNFAEGFVSNRLKLSMISLRLALHF